ncbi:MAG TPA: hypothetical protein VGH90_13660, partial [Chthoniobacteraceae bacterium]
MDPRSTPRVRRGLSSRLAMLEALSPSMGFLLSQHLGLHRTFHKLCADAGSRRSIGGGAEQVTIGSRSDGVAALESSLGRDEPEEIDGGGKSTAALGHLVFQGLEEPELRGEQLLATNRQTLIRAMLTKYGEKGVRPLSARREVRLHGPAQAFDRRVEALGGSLEA